VRQAQIVSREAAVAAFNKQAEERLAREWEERARLRRQKWSYRRDRIAALPEGAKILIGVLAGLVAIVALFVSVIRLAGK
jgi:hypothetical protein